MINKTIRRALSFLLVLVMTLSPCTAAIAAESRSSAPVLSFVSIGDEISAGLGLDGYSEIGGLSCAADSYPNMFAAWLAGYFGRITSAELEGYNGKVSHYSLATKGLLASELASMLDADGAGADYEYLDALRNADVVSVDLGRADFGAVMLDEIKRIAIDGDLTAFSSTHSVETIYAESSLPDNVKGMIKTLVSGYSEVIAELAGGFAGGDTAAAGAIDQVIRYHVVSFLVSYVEAIESIVKLNGSVSVVQLAMNEECTDGSVLVNGVSMRDFADVLYPSFNGIISSMPSVLITSYPEAYKNVTFYYAGADGAECADSSEGVALSAKGHKAVFESMRRAYSETYLKDSSSFYVALGDDSVKNRTTYVSYVASALGFASSGYQNLGTKGHGISDTLSVIEKNASVIAKADLITVGYSSNIFLKAAGDELNRIMMNQPATVFDWSKLFGEDSPLDFTDMLAVLEEQLIAEGLDIDFNGRNLKDMLISAIEAYAYTCVEHELSFPRLIDAIREKAPDALIAVAGFYNGVENVTIAVDGNEFDISQYVQLVVEFANAQNRYHTNRYDNTVFIDTPEVETVRESNGNTKPFSLTDFIREITSSSGASFLPSGNGCAQIKDFIVNEITKHIHDYSAVVTDPTCTSGGSAAYTCACGETHVESFSATGHDYRETSRTEPTCTEKGTVTFTCGTCGGSYTDSGYAETGHDYRETSRTEPTCTEKGTVTFTCGTCGDSYTDSGDAETGHDYKETSRTEPTCTEKGTVTFTCGTCGDSYTDSLNSLGHTTGTFCDRCGEHLCGGANSCPAGKFTDLDSSKWYHKSVDFVISTGLMNGQSPDRFGPDGETTRAMFVTTLYRLEGSPKVTGSASFTDVEAGMWYSDAILWAEQNSIVNGVGAGRFAPNDNVTREQIALMFYRYFNLKGVKLNEKSDFAGFTDKGDISDWARDAMSWAVGSGFITGRSATTLVPRANSNRSELATLLYRASSTFLK